MCLHAAGADQDNGDRGSSHGQIFPTMKTFGLMAFPGIGFQTFSGGHTPATLGFGWGEGQSSWNNLLNLNLFV
mgnify:CR=1 FL=1